MGAAEDATHECDADDARGDEKVAPKRDYAANDGAKESSSSFISCYLALSIPRSPTSLIPQFSTMVKPKTPYTSRPSLLDNTRVDLPHLCADQVHGVCFSLLLGYGWRWGYRIYGEEGV